MRILYISLLSLLFVFLSFSYSQSNNDQGIIHEMKIMQNQINTLNTELKSLKQIRNGSIVATNKPCKTLGENWVKWGNAANRFLLGNGTGSNGRRLNSTGGSERVTLSIQEIPSHSHVQVWGQSAGEAGTRSWGNSIKVYKQKEIQNTRRTGGSRSHENMPPYLVVNFCIYKES
ncbi:MAG: hypothetical protein R3F02_02765 [Thiolinea sp.]